MIRTLFFIGLGGTITLHILGTTGSSRFIGWAVGFTVATAILLALGILQRMSRRQKRVGDEIRQARQEGRVQAALILARHQTGTQINDQPVVDFSLLVDRPGQLPFLTNERKVVPLIDLHTIEPGALLTVVHPSPEHGDVHIVDDIFTPPASRWLTREAAATAETLPKRKDNGVGFSLPAALVAIAGLLVGGIGAPFLVTPDAPEYAALLFDGTEADAESLDNVFLFEASALMSTLDVLEGEIGHDEVFSVRVSDTMLTAEVATDAGATSGERVSITNHEIRRRDSISITADDADHARFTLAEIDWVAILDAVPEAESIVLEQGMVEPELSSISARRESTNLARIEVDISFAEGEKSDSVTVDASGAVAASEFMDLLPEEERATHLLDPDLLEAALADVAEHLETEQVVSVLHYGDRLMIDAYTERDGRGYVYEIDYRDGHVRDVDPPEPETVPEGERFALDDIDWRAVLEAVAAAEQEMADAGAADAAVTLISVDHSIIPFEDGTRLLVRAHISNDWDEGGFVELLPDGSLHRVSGP